MKLRVNQSHHNHGHADNTQFIIVMNPKNPLPPITTISMCFSNTLTLNTHNKLMGNPGKTEILKFSLKSIQSN